MEFPFWKIKLLKKEDPVKEIFEFLQKNPLFHGMKRRELWEISRLVHKREYKPGEVVFRQGQVGAGLFLIYKGSIRIHAQQENIHMDLAHLDEGSFFGELSLFSEEPRSATATAITQSTLLGFFKPELELLIQTKPRIGNTILVRFAQVITKRLIDTNNLLELAYLRGKKKKSETMS